MVLLRDAWVDIASGPWLTRYDPPTLDSCPRLSQPFFPHVCKRRGGRGTDALQPSGSQAQRQHLVHCASVINHTPDISFPAANQDPSAMGYPRLPLIHHAWVSTVVHALLNTPTPAHLEHTPITIKQFSRCSRPHKNPPVCAHAHTRPPAAAHACANPPYSLNFVCM